MKTYQAMLDEIESFVPWRGPALAPGVAGFIHAPHLSIHVSYTNSREYRVVTVDCLCGANLDYAAHHAPTDQPSPALWKGLEAFKRHLAERKIAAAISLEKLREDHYDARANGERDCRECGKVRCRKYKHRRYELSTGERE